MMTRRRKIKIEDEKIREKEEKEYTIEIKNIRKKKN